MNNVRTILALSLVPFFYAAAHAQARPATCEVRPLWVGRVRSANLGNIGRFNTDGHEGQTIRSFKHSATGLVITAGIDYSFDYSSNPQKPHEIRLAIAVSDKEQEDIFESVKSAEASTLYVKKWNLTVTQNVNFKDVIYMYTLRCWDTPKK